MSRRGSGALGVASETNVALIQGDEMDGQATWREVSAEKTDAGESAEEDGRIDSG